MAKEKKQPTLPDFDTLKAMFPNLSNETLFAMYKYLDKSGINIVGSIKMILRKNDRQQFTRRYVWENLPGDLTGDFIERILYYRFSGIFFYVEELNKFNFLPYVGKGLDEKGRYTECTPLPFNGKSEKAVQNSKNIEVYIPGLNFRPIYDISETKPFLDFKIDGDEITQNIFNPAKNGCVILNSYVKGLTQRETPEQVLIDPLLELEAEAVPLARTNVFANSGVMGMRVNNPDESSNVEEFNKQLEQAALAGKRYIGTWGMQNFQVLETTGNLTGENFFRYMQTLDNIRLESYGLKNNGIYEKDQYINNKMAGNIQANVGQIYEDGLKLRQDFCDYVNLIWGLGISCSASETVTNSDTNFDGEILDDNKTQIIAPDESQPVQEGEND